MLRTIDGSFQHQNKMRYDCRMSAPKNKLITLFYKNAGYRLDDNRLAERRNPKLNGRLNSHEHTVVNQIIQMINFVYNGRVSLQYHNSGINIYVNNVHQFRYEAVHNIMQCHDILYQRLCILVMGGPNSMMHHDPRDINHIIYPS